MASLSSLLTDHGSLLVLDAASTRVQVGLLQADAAPQWSASGEEAGRGIFTCTDALLKETRLAIDAIGAFVYCEGPGSMLGIRTVAMALRTWQVLGPRPAFAYRSLAVAGRLEWSWREPRAFSVVADARRDTWHCQAVAADGSMTALQRLPAGDLPEGEIVTPDGFRHWSVPPRRFENCSYELAAIFPALGGGEFFHRVTDPDAFQHEAPEYKKSPARIHSIATPAKNP